MQTLREQEVPVRAFGNTGEHARERACAQPNGSASGDMPTDGDAEPLTDGCSGSHG